MTPIGSSRLMLVGAASANAIDSNLKDMAIPTGFAGFLVDEADKIVAWCVEKDQNMLGNLLTTDQYFVMHHANKANGTATMQRWRGVWEKLKDSEWKTDPEKVVQPFKISHRKDLLSHPVWLVAHSQNTETDPVRRSCPEDMQKGVAIKDSTLTPVN